MDWRTSRDEAIWESILFLATRQAPGDDTHVAALIERLR